MRRFSFYRRGQTFYVRFWDPETKSYTPGMSTGQTTEKAAYAAVYYFEKHGKLPGRAGDIDDRLTVHRVIKQLRSADLDLSDAERVVNVLKDRGLLMSATMAGGPAAEVLTDWLLTFWDWEKSAYVAEKNAHGHTLTQGHCYDMTGYVRRQWVPYFGDKRVGEVTRTDIRDFGISLVDELSPQSVNHCIDAGRTALRWAHVNGLIASDPTVNLPKFAVRPKKRDILNAEEIRRLFSLEWPSYAAKLASLTAATTGLRAGEIAALRVEDIESDRLHVQRNYSKHDGIKSTKTGESRTVPLLPEIRDKLREHAAGNPWANGWIFWSTTREDKPLSPRNFTTGLNDALVMLTLPREDVEGWKRTVQRRSRKADPDPGDVATWERVEAVRAEWRERGIVFHSWRHYYTATMAGFVDRRAMSATGHKSAAMFEHYADHATAEQFAEVRDASILAFSNVIPFPGTDPQEAAQ